jgi:hypothetical protein
MGISDRMRADRPTAPARVHIDADAEVVVDLHVDDGPSVVTTDIRCPNCAQAMRVDDFDRELRAAQLSCVACGFTFLQRLQGPPPTPRALPHRKPVADELIDLRTPAERAETVRAGAEYFWSG